MFSSILNFILFILDKRVADWPLMDGISQTLALSGLYLLIVWLGPIYMQNKKPFNFRWTLVIYNLMLIILNFHIASEVRLTTELLKSLLLFIYDHYTNVNMLHYGILILLSGKSLPKLSVDLIFLI